MKYLKIKHIFLNFLTSVKSSHSTMGYRRDR